MSIKQLEHEIMQARQNGDREKADRLLAQLYIRQTHLLGFKRNDQL